MCARGNVCTDKHTHTHAHTHNQWYDLEVEATALQSVGVGPLPPTSRWLVAGHYLFN